jgi:DNA repair protein RadD
MTFELRTYQTDALELIMAAMEKKLNVLLQAATGSGKTIIFANLIKTLLLKHPDRNVLILTDRQELVSQAWAKLSEIWPTSWRYTGIACAGLRKVDTDSKILIGTTQTLIKKTIHHPIHLLIIDEVHKLPNKNRDSRYRSLIEKLHETNKYMRILGVTATPYRFNQGLIYGGQNSWFDALDFSASMADLIDEKWLVPIRIKITSSAGLSEDLDNVDMSTTGDYALGSLGRVMSKPVHIESAVHAWREYGEGRLNVCVFAVTIEHAELMTEAFNRAGLKAAVIHSKMPQNDRQRILMAFSKGDINFIVNVGILTEGWDSPKIDLIIMARPTFSVGLYVQMVGRGTRLYEGKENLLILDLAENYQKHGDPKDPFIKNVTSLDSEKINGKVCPVCKEVVPQKTMTCRCGYEWAADEVKEPLPLLDAGVGQMFEINDKSFKAEITSWNCWPHWSRAGNKMLKLSLNVKYRYTSKEVNHFFDFEGQAGPYARKRAREWWRKVSKESVPETVEEACDRIDELNIPTQVFLTVDGKYLKVKGW